MTSNRILRHALAMRLQHLPFTIGDAHDVVASIVRIVDLTGVCIDYLRQIAIDIAECRDCSDCILGPRSQVHLLCIAVCECYPLAPRRTDLGHAIGTVIGNRRLIPVTVYRR